MRRSFFLFINIVCCFYLAFAQEKPGGYIHGLIVGDYFYKSGGDTQPFGGTSQFSQPLPKDSSAFQIRRLHLFYDYNFSDEFSTRFQLEGNEKSIDLNGRLSLYISNGKISFLNPVCISDLYRHQRG